MMASAPIIAAPFGDDATHTALKTGADFRRLVCLDLSGDTSNRVTIMTAPGVGPGRTGTRSQLHFRQPA